MCKSGHTTCVHLTGPRHYFWVCLWGCFWKKSAFSRLGRDLPSSTRMGTIQSTEDPVEQKGWLSVCGLNTHLSCSWALELRLLGLLEQGVLLSSLTHMQKVYKSLLKLQLNFHSRALQFFKIHDSVLNSKQFSMEKRIYDSPFAICSIHLAKMSWVSEPSWKIWAIIS